MPHTTGRYVGYSGYCHGCRCDDCSDAGYRYHKQRNRDRYLGNPRLVDSGPAVRKIQALHRIGYTLTLLAEHTGYAGPAALHNLQKKDKIRVDTARRIDSAYHRLCMVSAPDSREARKAIAKAKKAGWPAPMDWEDIEAGILAPPPPKVARDRFDLSEVDYVLDTRDWDYVGKGLSRLEKIELFRRWIAWGNSENEICRLTGLRAGRYGRRFQHELPSEETQPTAA